MRAYLWKYFLEDDIDSFRQLLATAGLARSQSKSNVLGTFVGSPAPSSSPASKYKSKAVAASPATKSARTAVSLTRADLNSRDSLGNTILHYAASSTIPLAGAFVAALLEAAWLDLYIQDEESGWTCLHRALYMGNITIARALMERDIQDVDISGAAQHAGGLIKIKDREGNSPFDVYRLTIAPRLLPRRGEHFALAMSAQEDDPDTASSNSGEGDNVARVGDDAIINIDGDDVFTFGSNKNLNLGFGDDEDRQFPERITLKRPPHLLNRLYQEHQKKSSLSDEGQNAVELPAVTKYMGLRIQDVQLSKLHSAILTTDPESNLYICGFGPGGRLGTGDESTRFAFTCISGGGLVEKKVVAVGLGQNHTLAISSGGEVFSWGNNCYGQLGYAAANLSSRDGDPIQLSPRQIFGPLKRELVIGCAASRTHSVVFTSSSLFTFGKHDGQLGVFDSDARALAIQDTPRKVAASLFSSTISMVSAIEKATICLLDNHEVWVFANYGYTKVPFQREVPLTLSRHSLAGFRSNVVRPENLCIIKLASGGDTVCGLAKGGDVFTFTISQKSQPLSTSISTTNPSKIRGALSSPQQVWSLRKDHMAVTDVDVSQDGSIIICTESGSVWRRVRRAKLRDVNITTASNDAKKKDYKFSRVPGLTRVSAVRSNAFGAYAAIRKDFNVLKSQVEVDPKTLWADILSLLPFKELSASTVTLPYGKSPTIVPDLSQIRRTVLSSSNIGEDLDRLFSRLEQSENSAMDIRIGSTTKDIQIPCHEFVISARSPTLRNGFQKFRNSYFFEVTNTLTIEYDKTGRILVLFSSADILTVLNFILYCYSDSIVDFWHETKRQPAKACLYRQVRVELMKIASQLEVRGLERAARLMIEPEKLMHIDFQSAVAFPEFLDTGDIEIELDGASIVVHSALICRRCPFFDGLLNGRAKGSWLSSRREALEESDLVQVDMKHVDPQTFTFVVRYLYADPGEEIFDEVLSKDLDEFLDKVIDVMSVANELMLDRLSQICQKTVAKYVDTRNVCTLLNAIGACAVSDFKIAALEYICLNLEGMLENQFLIELDEDLMVELDDTVRQNQLACLPVSRSGHIEAELLDRYPQLEEWKRQAIKARIDSVMGQARAGDDEHKSSSTLKSPATHRRTSMPRSKASNELLFNMDDDPETKSTLITREHNIASSLTATPVLRPLSAKSQTSHDESLHSYEADSFPTFASSQNTPASHLVTTISDEFIASRHHHDNIPTSSVSQGSYEVSPWGQATLKTDKLDMKQIMAQASGNLTSNISTAFALSKTNAGQPRLGKLSQKERKKLQQAHQQETLPSDSPSTSTQSTSKVPPPWQIPIKRPVVSLETILRDKSEIPAVPSATRPLTLRQTVSGKTASAQVTLVRKTSAPQQSMKVDSSTLSSVGEQSKLSASKGKMIQSSPPSEGGVRNNPSTPKYIRHSSMPVEPSLQLSMADILAQQQSEKDIIKEASAKRSLQEIQQEQAFQEWWDQEEAATRARMEQEEVAAKASTRERGGRRDGEGAKSGRGKGRGNEGSSGRRDRRRGRGKGPQSQEKVPKAKDSPA